MVFPLSATLAQGLTDRTAEAVRSWPFRLTMIIMVAALLAGAFLISLVARWRRRGGSPSPSASEQLAQYRTLYEQGEISEEEFRRLRSLLGGQIRRELTRRDPESQKPIDPSPRQNDGDPRDPPGSFQDRNRPEEPS